jgi:Tfp pilus assembly pilus retraction ATPase PilT
MIRKGTVEQIASVLQSGKALGMHSFATSLERLVKARIISAESAQHVTGTAEH